MMNKIYFCIDLKTFYASVECAERNLNPFTTALVVADETKGEGTICLAITPYLKSLGVRNRCRLFEIPKTISYIKAMPRMLKYMEYSKDIYKIYLKYFSKEDIFVYSIDECFIDVTSYLKMYQMSFTALANIVIKDIYITKRICATAGIGTNLFLAKVALDLCAKHSKDNIGFLNEEIFKKTIWHYKPITDIWNIGHGIAKRLEKYKAYTLYDICVLDEHILYKEFGKNAEYLIDHAKGIEPCTIEDIHQYKPKNKSLSNRQILFEDYSYKEAFLILKEMVEVNVLNLISKRFVVGGISLSIGYSKKLHPSTGGRIKLDAFENSYKRLMEYFQVLYEKTTMKNIPIRKIGIGFFSVVDEKFKTQDLFTNEEEQKEQNLQQTIVSIKKKYGKNSILKGMNLEKKSTQQKRNTLVGGHNAKG